MIKFLQKLVILWEKSKFLTLMEMESGYIEKVNSKKLKGNIDAFRQQIAELKNKTDRSNAENGEIISIEAKINEIEKLRQIIQASKEKGDDLKNQIELYKKELWK